MKKPLLSFCGLISLSATAQEFGIKAGLNVPSFENKQFYLNKETDVLGKNNIGFYIGANFEYKLSEKFSLDADLLYSSISNTGNEHFLGKSEFQSLQVPLSFNYYPVEKLKVGAGASFNYYLKAEYIMDYSLATGLPNPHDPNFNSNDFDLYDNSSYGLHIATSYNVWNNVFVDVRYNIGLGNIYNSENEQNGESKYNNLQIGLSYKF